MNSHLSAKKLADLTKISGFADYKFRTAPIIVSYFYRFIFRSFRGNVRRNQRISDERLANSKNISGFADSE
jgi:hypothetical protein